MKTTEYPPTLVALAKISAVLLVIALAIGGVGAGCSYLVGQVLG